MTTPIERAAYLVREVGRQGAQINKKAKDANEKELKQWRTTPGAPHIMAPIIQCAVCGGVNVEINHSGILCLDCDITTVNSYSLEKRMWLWA